MRLPTLLALCAALSAADYYVSPSGSDGNAGTTAGTAWKTVAQVNTRSFAAGDRILFAGGQTFTDAGLVFGADDTGTAAQPITVGSYGSGRATLQPPAASHAISITNTAGLHLRDLVLVGPGAAISDSQQKRGVQAYCDLAGGVKLAGLTLENLDISGFYEGVTLGAWHSSFSGFQGVLITGCLLHDNLAQGFTSYGYQPGSASQQSHADIRIVDTEAARNYGDPTLSNPAAQHSGSGIILSGVKGGLIDRCYAHHNGGGAGDNAGGGPVGIWTYASDSVVIQRCLVHDQKTTAGSADGGGFDIDGGATNAVVQYCHSYGNEGPGYLICEYTGATPLQNAVLRYNISWRDGRRTANNMAGGFHFYSGENLASELQDVLIHNNLVYTEAATGGPGIAYQSGPMTGVRFVNNIIAVQGGERLVSIASNTAAFTLQGNLWWAVDGNYAGGWRWGATTYTTLAAWRAAAGTPETLAGNPVGLQADPLVASLVAGAQPTSVSAMEAMSAFRLLAGSPAKDAGQDLRTAAFGSRDIGTRDFFGGVIPVGALDIGPHERLEAGVLQFPAATQACGEGDGTAVITVRRVGGSSGALSVDWSATAGTAQAGADFTAASGTLSWADGETADQSIALTLLDDAADESDETVLVSLSGAALGSPTVLTLTIADDDAAPPPPPPATLAITSTPVTAALVGQPYRYAVTVAGSSAPVFALAVAPSGLAIDALTGEVTWTPAVMGSFPVVIQAGNGVTVTQSFNIEVGAAAVAPGPAPAATTGERHPVGQSCGAGALVAVLGLTLWAGLRRLSI